MLDNYSTVRLNQLLDSLVIIQGEYMDDIEHPIYMAIEHVLNDISKEINKRETGRSKIRTCPDCKS